MRPVYAEGKKALDTTRFRRIDLGSGTTQKELELWTSTPSRRVVGLPGNLPLL